MVSSPAPMLSLFLLCLAAGILWALWLPGEGMLASFYAWMAVVAFLLFACRLGLGWDPWVAGAAGGALAYRLKGTRSVLALASLLATGALGKAAWALPGMKAMSLATVGLSAMVLGVVLDAMVLGHWYLVQHGLSFKPLQRMSLLVLVFVLARTLLASLWIWRSGSLDALTGPQNLVFFLTRCLMGFAGPLALGWMVRECVKLKSNTSATGILYVVSVFVLVGEFSAAYFWASMGALL